ncbi:XS domain containing protein-like [Oryza sativa Japonica Group]|uniref:XS domain containing protein-like n=1 Tax=Oryza sativa subsp. japonica TaxID=39947 RepID=Q5N9Q4_ORYSJ|nr:XS domain containing protein-like [Oryza sativa Japonica Group]
MGWVIPTSTSLEADATWEHGLSADDVTGVRPVTDRSFLSTTCQFSMSHVCPSSYNDFFAMVAMKPGMYLAGTGVLTPGVSTPAPARDECLEALIIPTGRGEACDRPPAAT